MFNTLFSLLKKINYFPHLVSSINVWFYSNSNIFYYKLQNFIYFYIYLTDKLSVKCIKIFYKDISFFNIFWAVIYVVLVICGIYMW